MPRVKTRPAKRIGQQANRKRNPAAKPGSSLPLYVQDDLLNLIKDGLRGTQYEYLLKECHLQKIKHFLHSLWVKPHVDKRFWRDDYIPLKKEILDKLYGHKYYIDIIRALNLVGAIDIKNSYQVGEFTKAYRINLIYLYKRWHKEDAKVKPLFISKLKENKGRNRTFSKFECNLEENLWKLEIDKEKADAFIFNQLKEALKDPDKLEVTNKWRYGYSEGKRIRFRFEKGRKITEEFSKDRENLLLSYICDECSRITGSHIDFSRYTFNTINHIYSKYLADSLAIDRIYNKDWNFDIDVNGRYHTNLTNMATDLRQFLSLEGKPITGSDISNSQPLFFAIILINRFKGKETPEDVQNYIDLCFRGQFWEYLMNEANIPETERKSFKQSFFGQVFFNKTPKRLNRQAKAFSETFPEVWKIICQRKKRDYTRLACALQKTESDIMIGQIAKECVKRGLPVLTLHDAIFSTEEHIEEISEIILSKFKKKYCIEPHLKHEGAKAYTAGTTKEQPNQTEMKNRKFYVNEHGVEVLIHTMTSGYVMFILQATIEDVRLLANASSKEEADAADMEYMLAVGNPG